MTRSVGVFNMTAPVGKLAVKSTNFVKFSPYINAPDDGPVRSETCRANICDE